MKKLIVVAIFILIVGCGDTSISNTTDSSALNENNSSLTVPDCTACADNQDADIVYEKIIELAESFLEKVEIKAQKQDSDNADDNSITVTVEIVNDLVADSVSELNKGADSQEVITDFKTSLENIEEETEA